MTHRQQPFVALLGLCLASLLLLRGPGIAQRLHTNLGYLSLSRSLAHETQASASTGDGSPLISREPGSSREWRALGLAYMAQGRPADAAAAFSHYEGIDRELSQWTRRAERNKDATSARDWYAVATALHPENGDYWYNLGLLSIQLKDPGAADYFNRALDAAERKETGRSNILTRLGELEKRQPDPDWEQVLSTFDRAVTENDYVEQADVVQAHLGKAEALDRLGRTKLALAAYRQLLDIAPSHYWANVHSGRLTWQVERDAPRAVQYLERAIAVDDKPKWAYLDLGLVYARSGQPELAVPQFEKVLAIDPADKIAAAQLQQLAGGYDD